MSYINTLKNGEILKKKTKNKRLTSYDRFMAKRTPSARPYAQNLTFSIPKNFNELQKIVDELKKNNGAILSIENLSEVESQRTLDFISGVVYALELDFKKVSKDKYLLTPKGMEIVSHLDFLK